MYTIYKVRDVVRIPPGFFGLSLKEAASKVLASRYIGFLHPEMGIIVAVFNVDVDANGRILPGDGATYHEVTYEVLAFRPGVKEVVKGEVVNILNYGAWVNLGPVEGLVHVSQLMDDRLRFDSQRRAFIGERTGRIIEVGDFVRMRVVSVSMPSTGGKPRIQLTMKQPFLGKLKREKKELEKS